MGYHLLKFSEAQKGTLGVWIIKDMVIHFRSNLANKVLFSRHNSSRRMPIYDPANGVKVTGFVRPEVSMKSVLQVICASGNLCMRNCLCRMC